MTCEITVEIDELTLVGFDPRDRETVSQALRDELTRLLTQAPAPAADRRHAGAWLGYDLPHAGGPEAVGRAAARSIAGHVAGKLGSARSDSDLGPR